ncbi:TolC family protein [Burkholderiaceae bacterium DAT-1]|nr:TolC family protein [Burkholderiaceae bacterium DAT-1]
MKHLRPLWVLTSMLAANVQAETLDEAWQAALASNGRVKAAAYQDDAAALQVRAAKSLDVPSVNLLATSQHLGGPPEASVDTSPLAGKLAHTPFAGLLPSSLAMPLSERNVQLASLSLTYSLYTGGRIRAAQDAAGAQQDLVAAQGRSLRLTIKLSVAEAYLNVLRAQAAEQVAQQALATVQRHLDDVIKLEAEGLAAPVERLTAQVARSDASAKHIEAQQALEMACSAYNQLLGRPLDVTVTLAPVQWPARDDLPHADLLNRARAQRPELQGLNAGQTALRAQATAVRGEDKPQIALQAMQLNWNGLPTTSNRTTAIGVVMNWSLFDGGVNRNKAGALRAQADAVAEQQRDAESAIALDVQHSETALRNARARLQVAADSGTLAEEALKLTDARYHNGLANQTEWLAAQTRLNDARRTRLNADFDLQLARMRLLKAVGDL